MMEKVLETLEKHCNGCEVKKAITKKFSKNEAREYCEKYCAVGKGLLNSGTVLEHGVMTRTAKDLTKELYVQLRKNHSKEEICEYFGLSMTTLNRRRKKWGLLHYQRMNDFTVGMYFDLKELRVPDIEIAKRWGIGVSTLKRWKRENKIEYDLKNIGAYLLRTKTKQDYHELVAQGHDEKTIAKEWGVSVNTLWRWRKKVGLLYNPASKKA